jgi:hypothetical protein
MRLRPATALALALALTTAGCHSAVDGDDPTGGTGAEDDQDVDEDPGADGQPDPAQPDDSEEPDDGEEPDGDDGLGGLGGAGELRPGCTARGTLAGHPVWLHFTRPPAPCRPNAAGEAGVDTHILTELIRLIDSVPAGGRIDGNIFNITVDAVAAALLRAQDERGVTVSISTDGQVGRSTDSAKLKYLDKLARKVYCGNSTTDSCVGATSGSIAHTKLFVFSTATAPDGTVHQDVSWFGSANQTQASGMKTFNNTATIYGDASLYGQFRTYLGDLFRQARRTDYYDPASGRGHLLAAAADAYVSPETGTDLVVNRLDDITPDAECRVRVMQASIRDSRMAVVDQVVRMKRAGCKVWVVASTVEPRPRAALLAAGIPVRLHKVHDKVFLVYGKYGASYRYRVYTGSHNLSGSANRKYDEIFVKLAPETAASKPVYDAYFSHFNDAYNSGQPL